MDKSVISFNCLNLISLARFNTELVTNHEGDLDN